MTFFHGFDPITGMLTASAVVSPCVESNIAKLEDLRLVSQPSRFRSHRQPSAPAVGVCPDRKLGPEEKSHNFLTFGVVAARNVA